MSLKIVSLNLANAVRDEQTDYRLGTRLSIICQVLAAASTNADIILVQEIRQCRDESGEKMLIPMDIVSTIQQATGLACAVAQGNNPSDLSFYKATFYKPSVLFHVNSHTVWPSDTPTVPSGPQFGQNMMFSEFIVKDGSQHFRVCNVHTPMLENGRDVYFEHLVNYVNTSCGGMPMLMIGDFNTIPDLGGPKHIRYLEEHFHRASSWLGDTFTGFPHDVNPATGEPWQSQLDQVFVTGLNSHMKCEVAAIDEQVDGRRLSDHYTIYTTLTY